MYKFTHGQRVWCPDGKAFDINMTSMTAGKVGSVRQIGISQAQWGSVPQYYVAWPHTTVLHQRDVTVHFWHLESELDLAPAAPMTRAEAIAVFDAFIRKAPNINQGDYGGRNNHYYTDRSRVQRQRDRALGALEVFKLWTDTPYHRYRPDLMADAIKHTPFYSMDWIDGELHYTAGQNYPTEYRKAAAHVLERYVRLVQSLDHTDEQR